jgi:hypothetical protein
VAGNSRIYAAWAIAEHYELEIASKPKSQFLANASDCTPLNGIQAIPGSS